MFSFKYMCTGHWESNGEGKWSFLLTLNGVLTGMVSLCAGCDEYEPWGALIVGIFGGLTYVAIHTLMEKCKLDDPLDAVAVHGGGGKWSLFINELVHLIEIPPSFNGLKCIIFVGFIGVLMVPIFSMVIDESEGETAGGVFLYGDHPHVWQRLGVNLCGALVIMIWSAFWSILVFKGLSLLKLLRISEKTEEAGNDVAKHGESAYPMDSWAKLIESIFMNR